HRTIAAPALGMQRLGHELLAHARLAHEEHGRIGRCHLLDQLEDAPDPLASTDDAWKRTLSASIAAGLLLDSDDLPQALHLGERGADLLVGTLALERAGEDSRRHLHSFDE